MIASLQEFILRVKRIEQEEHFVARRYGDFHKLQQDLRRELPGKVLPILPKKNKADDAAPSFSLPQISGADSESSSISSASTQPTGPSMPQMGDSLEPPPASLAVRGRERQNATHILTHPRLTAPPIDHRRGSSGNSGAASPRPSADGRPRTPLSGGGKGDVSWAKFV